MLPSLRKGTTVFPNTGALVELTSIESIHKVSIDKKKSHNSAIKVTLRYELDWKLPGCRLDKVQHDLRV